MSTTTGAIMTALAGITYSTTSHTVVERFQNWDEEFEDFTNFPVVVVTDGDEENEPQANKIYTVTYHPEVHFYAENQTAANMKSWREEMRAAIMNDVTLEGLCIEKNIDEIVPSLSATRKLQHLAFYLTITFDREFA